MAEIRELIEKNVVALIEAGGYDVVRKKERSSRRFSTRLTRQKNVLHARGVPDERLGLVDANKYFTVEVDARPGINHLREALNWVIRESLFLGRTPVAFVPHFDTIHNFGKEVQADWSKYIDLNHLRIGRHGQTETSIIARAIEKPEIADYDGLSVLRIERDHIVTDKENDKYDLIIRHNRTGLKIDRVHEGRCGLAEFWLEFEPSDRVLQLYHRVKEHLGLYHAVHVRRGDMLAVNHLYPNLDRDTRPAAMRDTLSKIIPDHGRLYILTNESDKAHFDALKSDYEVLQYFDFPELLALIECEQPDNFLLFEVEKLLFENAETKIHTFARPDGVARHSLSQDQGWA